MAVFGAPVAQRRPGPTVATRVDMLTPTGRTRRPDRVVTEEPLEIRVHGPGEEPRPVTVTMRTPGSDFDLAVGLLLTEGIVDVSAVESIAYCLADEDASQHYNVVTVRCRTPVHGAIRERSLAATSGCGVCGKRAIDDLEVRCAPVAPGPVLAFETLAALPARLEGAQGVFVRTGGLHAAARFDASGELVALREDVGRHNALDKLIGDAARNRGLPAASDVLLLSGRAGFELVQKAAVAGFPIVASVSAPSSLAITTADRLGITLLGFLRDGRANVYSHTERVTGP